MNQDKIVQALNGTGIRRVTENISDTEFMRIIGSSDKLIKMFYKGKKAHVKLFETELKLTDVKSGSPAYFDFIVSELLYLTDAIDTMDKSDDDIRVIDCGHGAGIQLRVLGQLYPQVSFHGYDLNKQATKYAKKKVRDLDIEDRVKIEGPLSHTSCVTHYGEERFDMVYCIGSIPDKKKSELHMGNILKLVVPGGKYVYLGAFTGVDDYQKDFIRSRGFSILHEGMKYGPISSTPQKRFVFKKNS